MKKHRRKIIITAGILAAVLALGVALACNGSPSEGTVRKVGQEKPSETAAETTAEKETIPKPSKKTGCTAAPETTVHEETGRRGMTAIRRYAVQEMTESNDALYEMKSWIA